MVRWVASLLVFGGLLVNGELLVAQIEDGRVKILLERIIGDGPLAERRRAERELERLGEDAVFGLMLIATENPDDNIRAQAMETFERIVSGHPEWRIRRLVDARIDYFMDREYVTEEFGEDAEEFLIQNAGHPLAKIRRNALYLLSFLELPGDKVLPIYRKGLEDADPTVRVAAAVGLFHAGERIPAVLKLLVGTVATEQFNDMVKETIRRNKLYFNELLARRIIDPESSDQVYHASIDLIQGYGRTAGLSAAFNPLREALHSENRTVQVRAAMALAKLEYDTPSVANVLAEEIENAGPMRDTVLKTVENSFWDSMHLDEAILNLTRGEDPKLVKRGFSLARRKQLAQRHAEELAEHLLSESRLFMAVMALERPNHAVPFKAEYVPPLRRLIFQGRDISSMAINVLLNMGAPGLEEALKLLDEPDLPDSMRIILIQKIALQVRDLHVDDPLRGALDRVAKNLNHENPWVTTRTAIALLEAGYDQGPLIPFLLRGYASQNSEISGACYGALFYDSKEDDVVVAFLLKRLEDSKPEKRKRIIELLNSIGSHSPPAVDIVVEYMLNDMDDFDREQFAYEIKEPVAEALTKFFEEGTIEKRRKAMETMRDALEYSKGSYENEWKTVEGKTPPPGIIAASSAEDKGLRFSAAMLLLNYQPAAEEALPVLREALISDDIEVRLDALRVLSPFGPAATPLLPELLAVLKEGDIVEPSPIFGSNYYIARRQLVLSVLERMGPKAAPALPDLIELLEDPEIGGRQIDWRGHSGVPEVLASIGEAAKPAEPFLIDLLPDAEGLTPIGKALKSMGGSTVELIAEIDRRLDDPVLCYQAVEDLQVISDIEPVTPRLIKILKGDNLLLKREVADMFSVRGLVRDPVLVPLLKELLQEESARVRETAIGALAEHDVPVQVLVDWLQNDEPMMVRQAVVEALATYSEPLMKAYRRHASRSTDAEIFTSVQRGDVPELSAMAAIPALEEVLRSTNAPSNSAEYLRIEAAYTLAKFGETAKRSLPLLLELHRTKQDSEELVKFSRWGVKQWQNALLTAIWSIDLETAIENNLPRPKPRRDW